MLDGFVLAKDLAENLIANSTQVWQQILRLDGLAAEAVEDAWRRLFGQPIPKVPVLFSAIETQDGCNAVVRLYKGGRFVCIQGGFSSIRVLNHRSREQSGNIADMLTQYDPLTAYKHTSGIVETTDADFGFESELEPEQWFDWAASLPPNQPKVSVSAESHHSKVGGATQLFLESR